MSQSRRLRILVVMNQLVRGYAGGDFHAVQVLNRWSADHDVEVLLPDVASEELIRLLGPEVRFRRPRPGTVPTSWRRLLATYFVRMAGSAWHVFRHRGHWDAVIASTHYPFDVAPLLVAGRRRARFVYWHHHFVATTGRPFWLRLLLSAVEWMTMRIFSWAGVNVFTSSTQTREHLLRHGLRESQILMTTNSTSLQPAAAREADPGLRAALEGKPFALFCARISKLKGSSELRALIPALLRQQPGCSLVIAGDGPEAAQLKRLCQDLGAGERVLFPGFVSEATKAWLFRHARVLLAPSYEEGWGITVCDGLTTGCAVVSYAVPAVMDAFPEGPVYVPIGDRAHFVRAALACLGDEPGSKGRRRARRPAGWEEIARSELQIISAAVSRSPNSPPERAVPTVFLLTSHPVAAPWNSGDKNMARALLLGTDAVSYAFLKDPGDTTPWPEPHRGFVIPGRTAMWEGAIPTRREKLRVYAGLWTHYPAADIAHVLMTLDGGRFAETALLGVPWLRRQPLVVTCLTMSYLPWRLLRRAAAVAAISERTGRILASSGIAHVAHIPPGVDLDAFRPQPPHQRQRELGLPPGRYLLFAGHQDPGGGLEPALEMLSAVRRLVPDIRLLLALRSRPGQHPARLRAELDEKILAAGLAGAVTALGPRADMPRAIGAAAAVLFPATTIKSKMELPLVLLEALASGRPIVTSPLEPLPEIADGSPAVFIGRPEDPSTVEHLARLLTDHEFHAGAAAAARALAESRYDVCKMTEAYRALYAEVLGVPLRRPAPAVEPVPATELVLP